VGLFDVTQLALERAMSGAAYRQRLLANNIANANTPGYRRSDVDFHGTLQRALETGSDEAGIERAAFTAVTDPTTGRADGNNVDMDAEMASLSENAIEYQTLVAVAKARIRILENVIGSTR
jgi:flagellar basal-body rod protein FlgB